MRHAPRQCTRCRLPVEVSTPSCPRCGSTDLIMRDKPALIALLPTEQRTPAPSYLLYEEPMVRCAFCHQRIAAAQAYHSRYDGQAVCWPCKQAEKA